MPEKSSGNTSPADVKRALRERIAHALWWRQLRSAIVINAACDELHDVAMGADDALSAARAAALHVRRVLPYRFTGAERILDLRGALLRGYGACGDATAAVVAVVLLGGAECAVEYETARCDDGSEPLPGYAHVRVVVGGTAVDAYADESLAVDGRWSVPLRITREGVLWPMTAHVAYRSDARRPRGIPRS